MIWQGDYVLFSDIPNNRIMRYSEDDGHVRRLSRNQEQARRAFLLTKESSSNR
jgi:sugar lactone lactonase YvrE